MDTINMESKESSTVVLHFTEDTLESLRSLLNVLVGVAVNRKHLSFVLPVSIFDTLKDGLELVVEVEDV